jgi:hypothetical protein
MDTSSPTPSEKEFNLYRQLVMQSRQLGRIRVRKSLYAPTLNARIIELLGSSLGAILLVVLAVIGVTMFGLQVGTWSKIISLGSVVILGYAAFLFTIPGNIAELPVLIRKESFEGIYSTPIRKICNRFTLLVIPPVLVIIVALLGVFLPVVGEIIAGIIALLGLSGFFIGNLIVWPWKNIRDYQQVIASLLGKRTTVVRTTDELVVEICHSAKEIGITPMMAQRINNFAEKDLERASTRLEMANLYLAILAVILGILFSDQIVNLLLGMIRYSNQFFLSLAHIGGAVFKNIYWIKWLFEKGLYISVWAYIVNFLLSMGFLFLRELFGVYFSYYRPAYALSQAINILCNEIFG